jgi:two-component system, OmpR family, alkaline phosphatase synthesis response regulator PhoP
VGLPTAPRSYIRAVRACVLVAEDDERQAEIVRRYLEREGWEAIVVHDGRSAIDEARRRRPDLLLLDVMMPAVDGLDVCRALRQETDAPVLMLTARSTEDDLLLALDLGADDYMTKPYSPRELMARVRALLRRAQRAEAARAGDQVVRLGDLVIDVRRHRVEVRGAEIDCTPGQFALLATLAAEPDRVFDRNQLLTAIHGTDAWITPRTVDVHVMNLRKKIELDARRPERLITVFGVGYKLASP